MIITFWISIFIIFYAFAGYGIILYFLVLFKRKFFSNTLHYYSFEALPTATLIIAAFNEADIIRQKIDNTLALKYPANTLKIIIVTDGSSDGTHNIVEQFPQIILLHNNERKGKINAVHRAMEKISTEIVIFTDANTFLNTDALINIARHYKNEKVGAVAGEKRVQIDTSSDATAGEGFYWKYESALKKWDSELYSVVGAAGELFSIRTALYKPVSNDIILDDFMLSMNIAMMGYKIVYEPEAYAIETSSANVKEELKRKIRIAAGGIQSIIRLKGLFNLIKYPVLSFQYISHRVLRWTITPFLLVLVFLVSIYLLFTEFSLLYALLLLMQIIFYTAAAAGWLLQKKQIKIKILFIPYYFCLMNVAVVAGIIRYIKGTQQAAWDKAKRKDAIPLIISE